MKTPKVIYESLPYSYFILSIIILSKANNDGISGTIFCKNQIVCLPAPKFSEILDLDKINENNFQSHI